MLGYVDDLVLVPAGIWLTLRLIPTDLVAELRAQAPATMRPVSRAGAAAVLLAWAGLAAAAFALLT